MTAVLPPRSCIGCGRAKVAWTKPRVDYCYACLPGGPFTPPTCRRCGTGEYFSQGLCDLCHAGSPKAPGSCKDCLAWGVLRAHNWRCWGCRGWRSRHPVAQCPYCARQMPIGGHGACRLCWHQAQIRTATTDAVDIADANRDSQQLFLANIHSLHQRRVDHQIEQPRWQRALRPGQPPARPFRPVAYRQLALFSATPDLRRVDRLPAAPLPAMSAHLDAVLRDSAEHYGWSDKLVATVRLSLQVVQRWQETPGAAISAADAEALLRQRGLTIALTLQVLRSAGLLEEDRDPTLRVYFDRAVGGLPQPVRGQLETWYLVMTEGSVRPPRRRPRDQAATHWQIRGLAPCLHAWAARGIDTLTAVTTADIVDVLPTAAVQRSEAVGGLRSLFGLLKARREVFTNPALRVDPGQKGSRVPLALDVATIRAALADPHPARALAVALVVFHGLAARDIRHALLTDIVDGRMRLGRRNIPLAEPVRVRLRAYLDERARLFTATSNPYLLVNRKNATRTTPVGAGYPWHRHTINAKSLREDRILHEMFASGGDVRRVCDLFGLSVPAACRYTTALPHPDLDQRRDA